MKQSMLMTNMAIEKVRKIQKLAEDENIDLTSKDVGGGNYKVAKRRMLCHAFNIC